jgi:hypothetical protein
VPLWLFFPVYPGWVKANKKKAVSPWRNGLAGIGQFYFYMFPYAGIIQVRFRGCDLRQFLPPLKYKFDNQTLRNRVLDVKGKPYPTIPNSRYG